MIPSIISSSFVLSNAPTYWTSLSLLSSMIELGLGILVLWPGLDFSLPPNVWELNSMYCNQAWFNKCLQSAEPYTLKYQNFQNQTLKQSWWPKDCYSIKTLRYKIITYAWIRDNLLYFACVELVIRNFCAHRMPLAIKWSPPALYFLEKTHFCFVLT